jgi:uncharacterized membrane protein
MSSGQESAAPGLFGPLQMLVLGFDEPNFTGEILPELKRLGDEGMIRLVDLLVVTKNNGEIQTVQVSDLTEEEAAEFGAVIGALIGLGTGDEETMEVAAAAGAEAGADGHLLDEAEVWYLADVIPDGGYGAIALLEHRWAIPLRDKIAAAGGYALADEWIHPADLVAIGAAAAEQA